MKSVVLVAKLLFLLAVPVWLVATNVWWEVNFLPLYRYGFEKYRVTEATGVAAEELERAAQDIRRYFRSGRLFGSGNEGLDTRVTIGGVEQPLYTQQELLHMRDVRGLVHGVYRVHLAIGGYLLLYVVAGLVAWRRAFLIPLLRAVFHGSTVAVVLLLVAGVALAVAFPWLFTLFHLVSFRNPFWQLDPSRDRLITMFPEGFWYSATMLLALAILVEAALLGGASYLILRRVRRKQVQEVEGQGTHPPTVS